MNSIAKYQSQRDQYWPEVERYFSQLSPALFRQGVLLKNNLAIAYSDTGQFKDILGREQDHPLLTLHFWLLDDLKFPNKAERANLERYLLLAMTFTFASIYTQQTILDEGSSFDNSFLLLAQVLSQQAHIYLAHLYPGPSPFWHYHHSFWQESAEAVLWRTKGQPSTIDTDTLEGWAVATHLAFTKIPLAAVAISAGQEMILPRLLTMMDRLNFIFQLMRDISTLKRDLAQRNYTYPIIRTMKEAGIDPNQMIVPERVLGALILTGSIEKMCQEGLGHLDMCRDISDELNLPTFAAHFDVVEDLIIEVKQLFSLKAKSPSIKRKPAPQKLSRNFFQAYTYRLNTALEMAEGYLLSDLTFRESWEVQRGGLLNLPQIMAKAFPSGLIIEALCRNGHNLSPQVDAVFESLARNKFRYYDEVQQLPPDADDLGLLLRLHRYSGQKEAHCQLLKIPLGWMKESILPSGEIPVWFRSENGVTNHEALPGILVWGNSCATTESNLLLGLIDYDWTGYQDIIERSTLNLLDRFRATGLGASLYYLPPYILWTAFELISGLLSRSIGLKLQERLNRATDLFLERLTLETKRHVISPQDAAFLTLTCHSIAPAELVKPLFEERWITILLKSQRHDGRWDHEPLFLIPDRQEGTAWYASHSVTTAFCYHALKSYQRR